jgi:hypothetical protein
MRKILLLVVAAFSLATCGSSDDGGGGGSLCQQIGNMACAKACSCRDGAACAMMQGDATSSVTITFDSEADCQALFVTLGCSMGDAAAYNDAAACLPLITAATCSSTGAEGALGFPTDNACQSPP